MTGAKATQDKAIARWRYIEKKGEMKCSCCEQIKPLTEFTMYKKHARKYNSWNPCCRVCKRPKQIVSHRKRISRIDQKITVILNAARQRCLKLNKDFDLTKEFILDLYDKQEGKCFYTGIELIPINIEDSSNHHCLSIDRIDSNKSYTKDNVVLCCWIINRIKINLSIDEFVNYCSLIANKFVSNELICNI